MSDVFVPVAVNQATAIVTVEYTRVACVYLRRWSAPITLNGIVVTHGTGYRFGWNGEQWVSIRAFRRGGRRHGQWGERARKRRAKRRERARFTRGYKRFDRYLETRQGQNWFDLENARDPSEGP